VSVCMCDSHMSWSTADFFW